MSHWNMPPGVSTNDIPWNEPEAPSLPEAAYELNEVVCAFLNGEHPFERGDAATKAYDAALAAALDASPPEAEQRTIAAMQAKIDALMLEYCPDEMTPEQVAEWGKHQVAVTPEGLAALGRSEEKP